MPSARCVCGGEDSQLQACGFWSCLSHPSCLSTDALARVAPAKRQPRGRPGVAVRRIFSKPHQWNDRARAEVLPGLERLFRFRLHRSPGLQPRPRHLHADADKRPRPRSSPTSISGHFRVAQPGSKADAGTRTPDPFITSGSGCRNIGSRKPYYVSELRSDHLRFAEFGTYLGTRPVGT